MNTRAVLSLSLSALMLGGTMVGCATGGGGGIASAGDRNAAAAERQAANQAGKAVAALTKHKPDEAIGYAEAAVTLAPRDIGYRMTLGQSYLKAGRFTSASQAFADALTLTPDNGVAALNLALAQTANGRWDAARRTLDDHAQRINASDRGLAMALAGDPQGAVQVLMAAARTPGATAKTRQNLALALALAGHWAESKAVVAADLAPAEVDARILQWAAFAQPKAASDQVAALLGVVPVADAGQPVALALNAPVMPASAVAVAEASAPAIAAPVQVALTSAIRFVPHEVVQPLPVEAASPAPRARPVAAPVAVAVAVAKADRPAPVRYAAPAKGDWYVQLGAYQNAAVARDGWSRATRREVAFRGHVPAGVQFASPAGPVYRLSVGGFARTDAVVMCRRYHAKGGACFVRQGAGDQVAQWVGKRVQVAARPANGHQG